MGFFDKLASTMNKLDDLGYGMSEKIYENAKNELERAERDYDNGRISFEKYSEIFNKNIELMSNSSKCIDNYRKRKNNR